eukprot:7334715-Pyramimonas_sp.AAC.1
MPKAASSGPARPHASTAKRSLPSCGLAKPTRPAAPPCSQPRSGRGTGRCGHRAVGGPDASVSAGLAAGAPLAASSR